MTLKHDYSDWLPPGTYRIKQEDGCYVLEIDGNLVPLKPANKVASDAIMIRLLARFEVMKRHGAHVGEDVQFRWVPMQ